MPIPTVTLTHATLVARPFHCEGWVYEEKVDGPTRTASASAASGHAKNLTARFPELMAAIANFEPETVPLTLAE
jgi:hypothetical protein